MLRKRWESTTVKINGNGFNPARWPDGSYSVQGAAVTLGIAGQIVFKWMQRGRLTGRQLAKGQPWQITLSGRARGELRARVRHTSRSRSDTNRPSS